MMVPAHVLSGMVCLHLGQMVAKRKDGRTRWSNLPEWTWLALGLIFAFLSHAVVDTLAIFTYHDGSPSGSLFSRLVFWGWMLGGAATIAWGLWTNVRYGYGMLMALIYDLSDHYLLRFTDGVLDGFPAGFMSRYTHRFEVLQLHRLEWFLLDNLFAGVERHYGDPRFVMVEILFVGWLIASLAFLRRWRPLIPGGERENPNGKSRQYPP